MMRVQGLSRLRGRDGLNYRGEDEVAEADRAHDRALIAKAGAYCAAHGITTAVNMDGNRYQAGLLRDLALAGTCPCASACPCA